MKIDITENKENALMKRNVVRTIIHHEGKATPYQNHSRPTRKT